MSCTEVVRSTFRPLRDLQLHGDHGQVDAGVRVRQGEQHLRDDVVGEVGDHAQAARALRRQSCPVRLQHVLFAGQVR